MAGNGKSPFSIGNTSTQSGAPIFQPAMVVYRSVFVNYVSSPDCSLPEIYNKFFQIIISYNDLSDLCVFSHSTLGLYCMEYKNLKVKMGEVRSHLRCIIYITCFDVS